MSFDARRDEAADAREREADRSAEPPAPDRAASLPAGDPSGGSRRALAGPTLRPSALLALQRTIGNRDVQRLLSGRVQRDAPPAATPASAPSGGTATSSTGLDATMLDITGGDLQKGGNVTAKPKGDQVTIESPPVSYSATVSLKSGVTLGEGDQGRIDVGPVQTVLGGDIVGVYRKGGDPNGDVTAREQQHVGQVRDAQWRTKPGGGREAAVPAPWYSQPNPISDKVPSTPVSFSDTPGVDWPLQLGEGRLTETTGQDRFVVSIGAKRGGQLIHLKPQHWEVPWNLTIDTKGNAAGGPVTGGAAREGPPTTDGPIAVEAARAWTAFTSIEAAMAASPAVLLENLLPAKAHDPTAYGYLCEALRRKNPSFSVKVKVEKKSSWLHDDHIIVAAAGTKAISKPELKLDTGAEGTATFAFNEVFDAAAIDGTTKLTISAQDFGEMFAVFKSDPLSFEVGYPFAPKTQTGPAGGGSRYTLSFSF